MRVGAGSATRHVVQCCASALSERVRLSSGVPVRPSGREGPATDASRDGAAGPEAEIVQARQSRSTLTLIRGYVAPWYTRGPVRDPDQRGGNGGGMLGERENGSSRGRSPANVAGPLLISLSVVGVAGAAGQTSPASVQSRVFAPGVISTEAIEHGAAFTPDGESLYFTRRSGRWGDGGGPSSIMVAHRSGDGWSRPEPASFNSDFDDSDPFVSPDGARIYFTSNRPGGLGAADIWVFEPARGGADNPRPLAGDVNSAGEEYSPVITLSGNLYFASTRPGGLGRGDLYVAEPTGEGFGAPRNLGPEVNSPFGEWNLLVDPTEDVLIFEGSGRALNLSTPGDLYLSRRTSNGWSPSVPMTGLNTTGSELMPRLTPEGDRLLFASSGSLEGVHTDVFETPLRPLLDRVGSSRPALLAASRSGAHVAVVDPQTLQISRRIETGAGPHEVAALTDGWGAAAAYGIFPTPHAEAVSSHPGWEEVAEGNTVTVFDAGGVGPSETLTIPDCRRAHGILASEDGAVAWITCEEEATVVELSMPDGAVRQRWATDHVGSHRLVATHRGRYLVVANVEAGNVTVIDRHRGARTVLDTGGGSEGLAATTDGRVWVAASAIDTLSEVDPATGTVLRSMPSRGRFPISLAVDEERGEIWVANMGPRSVDILGLEDGEHRHRIQLDSGPLRVLVVPGSRHAYVSLPRENAIAVVDRESRQVVARVPDVMEVDGLDWVMLPPP